MGATNDLLQARELKEGTVYLYRNHIATYHLRIYKVESISSKYPILCHSDQFGQALAQTIDTWEFPQYMDLLDLTACVYSAYVIIYPMFFLQSFKIGIELIELQREQDLDSNNPFHYTGAISENGKTVVSLEDFR
ncbi:hypothetical protein [Rufibacter immobilis]|uniref:hypothetical protein n=1 Tax=Rufibacter immobilis TaxID=1348778 RepID=UPI0035E79625